MPEPQRPDDEIDRDDDPHGDEPVGAGSLADVVGGEPGDRTTRRTTLTTVSVAVLFGVALVAAAPMIGDAVSGTTGPQATPEAAATSGSPASAASTAQPSGKSEQTSGKDDKDRTEGDKDEKNKGDQQDSSNGDSSSNDDTDSGSQPHSGGPQDGTPSDDGAGTDDGTSHAGPDEDSEGSASGSDSDSGSDSTRHATVWNGKAFTLKKVCFPGRVIDLDTGQTAGDQLAEPYDLKYGGCTGHIDGNVTTLRPTAVLGGSGQPSAAACAEAAQAAANPISGEQLPTGTRLCTTTDGGRVAYIVVTANNKGGYAPQSSGSLEIAVTTWKK